MVTRKTLLNDPPSHQFCPGCQLPLLFPSGLLDLFLMCIYKEFTVGKRLGLPQSAIWVFFLLLCAYLSISGKEVLLTYIALPFGGGGFSCAQDTASNRLRCLSDEMGLGALSSKFIHQWVLEIQIRVSLRVRSFSLPQVIQLLLLLSTLVFLLPSLIVIQYPVTTQPSTIMEKGVWFL